MDIAKYNIKTIDVACTLSLYQTDDSIGFLVAKAYPETQTLWKLPDSISEFISTTLQHLNPEERK